MPQSYNHKDGYCCDPSELSSVGVKKSTLVEAITVESIDVEQEGKWVFVVAFVDSRPMSIGSDQHAASVAGPCRHVSGCACRRVWAFRHQSSS